MDSIQMQQPSQKDKNTIGQELEPERLRETKQENEQEQMPRSAGSATQKTGVPADINQKVNITYETLFDILRAEKGRNDIQELSESFFQDVVTYLKQKKDMLRKKEHESGIDSFDVVKKMRIQYENVERLIKEIYQRREKKILSMALNSSRTSSRAIDDGFLLKQEKVFFERVKFVLDENRRDNLILLLQGKIPITEYGQEFKVTKKTTIGTENKKETQEIMEKAEKHRENNTEREKVKNEGDKTLDIAGFIQLRFLKNVGQFIGPELETYGPFLPGAVTPIPEKIAEILIADGKAETLKN